MIPLSGVFGAVKGAVGRSICCVRVRNPALIVPTAASLAILASLNGLLEKLNALRVIRPISLGSGLGFQGRGSFSFAGSGDISKIKLIIPAPAIPSIATWCILEMIATDPFGT